MGYQLIRCGKSSTARGVKDVFELTEGVNTFGRHSRNLHYLESSVLQHFISRWHAEIVYTVNKGRKSCVLKDKGSINGTYVNDTRVDKEVKLSVGDIITFGHTNGKHIAPGQHSPQADSEFQFVLRNTIEESSDGSSQSESEAESASESGSESEGELPRSVTRPPLGGRRDLYNADNQSRLSSNGTESPPKNKISSPRRGRPKKEETSTSPKAASDSKPKAKRGPKKVSDSTINTKRKKSGGKGDMTKRRRTVSSTSNQSDSNDDLDAAVNSTTTAWHYVSQDCDAPTCKHPQGQKVQWVQCDDCEKWYHIHCVGISYSSVKSDDAEFNCGFC